MEFNIVETLLGMTALGSEWVLWLCIVTECGSISIMLERFVYFRRLKVDFASVSDAVSRHLADGDLEAIKAICYANPSLETQALLRGLNYRQKELRPWSKEWLASYWPNARN